MSLSRKNVAFHAIIALDGWHQYEDPAVKDLSCNELKESAYFYIFYKEIAKTQGEAIFIKRGNLVSFLNRSKWTVCRELFCFSVYSISGAVISYRILYIKVRELRMLVSSKYFCSVWEICVLYGCPCKVSIYLMVFVIIDEFWGVMLLRHQWLGSFCSTRRTQGWMLTFILQAQAWSFWGLLCLLVKQTNKQTHLTTLSSFKFLLIVLT